MLVEGLEALIGEVVRASELLGQGSLDKAVGEGEAGFQRQGLGDLEVGDGTHVGGGVRSGKSKKKGESAKKMSEVG